MLFIFMSLFKCQAGQDPNTSGMAQRVKGILQSAQKHFNDLRWGKHANPARLKEQAEQDRLFLAQESETTRRNWEQWMQQRANK